MSEAQGFAHPEFLAETDWLAAHPGERRGEGRIDAFRVMRVAAAFDKGTHRARGLGLA